LDASGFVPIVAGAEAAGGKSPPEAAGSPQTERRQSRTDLAVGCTAVPVLKTG
jgi:hypothetical protein